MTVQERRYTVQQQYHYEYMDPRTRQFTQIHTVTQHEVHEQIVQWIECTPTISESDFSGDGHLTAHSNLGGYGRYDGPIVSHRENSVNSEREAIEGDGHWTSISIGCDNPNDPQRQHHNESINAQNEGVSVSNFDENEGVSNELSYYLFNRS